jgi:hypothetical protein
MATEAPDAEVQQHDSDPGPAQGDDALVSESHAEPAQDDAASDDTHADEGMLGRTTRQP